MGIRISRIYRVSYGRDFFMDLIRERYQDGTFLLKLELYLANR